MPNSHGDCSPTIQQLFDCNRAKRKLVNWRRRLNPESALTDQELSIAEFIMKNGTYPPGWMVPNIDGFREVDDYKGLDLTNSLLHVRQSDMYVNFMPGAWGSVWIKFWIAWGDPFDCWDPFKDSKKLG